jgi:fructose-1,6-bisphosphatase/inositol monophosphatase family enzyme
MNLTDSDLTQLRELAMTAATQAGAHIQAKVGQHRESNTKEAGNTLASQVVTEVDLESQTLILEILHDSIDKFQLGLLTEESEDDSSRFNTDKKPAKTETPCHPRIPHRPERSPGS